jgi:hypothetical protein
MFTLSGIQKFRLVFKIKKHQNIGQVAKVVLNSRGNNSLWLNAYYKTEGFTYTTLDMSSVCRKSTQIMLTVKDSNIMTAFILSDNRRK